MLKNNSLLLVTIINNRPNKTILILISLFLFEPLIINSVIKKGKYK